jgi:hypothetical protein
MPLATVLPEVPDAFSPLEQTKVYLYKTITAFGNPAAPTRAEINGGVDITAQIADWAGFTVTTELIDVPNIANKYVSRIGGRITAEDSSITFHLSETGADIRAHLRADESGIGGPAATRGWLLLADAGDAAGLLADLYPFECTSMGKVRALDSNLRITAGLAFRTRPYENVALPAA